MTAFLKMYFLSLPLGVVLISTSSCGDNLSASLEVTGQVYEDRNGNTVFDEGEGISGWTVALESMENGQTLEAITDSQGLYRFEDISEGGYVLRQEMQNGWRSAPQSRDRVNLDGDVSPKMRPDKLSRIIGGSESKEAEYPFMASVGQLFNDQFFHFCGGALISDRFVVTAAHCSEDVDPAEVSVNLGTNDPAEIGTAVGVSAVIVHPNWEGDTTTGYDMALWKLDQRLDLEALGLNTVTMLEQHNRALAQTDRLASALGWGVSDLDTERLQEVHLPIVSDESCGQSYPVVASFETQICAGLPEGGLDSCQGDSGGPLLVRDHEQKRWLHAGVTSWGRGCAAAGFPGIYGRTSTLSEWAFSQMFEPSERSYQIQLSRSNVSADFGNQRTTRELFGDIDVRWGMAALVPSEVRNGTIEENTAFSVSFTLVVDEMQSPMEFVCALDRDGEGPGPALEFACQVGRNELPIEGYPAGTVIPRISVQAGSRTKTRDLELEVLAAPSPRTPKE